MSSWWPCSLNLHLSWMPGQEKSHSARSWARGGGEECCGFLATKAAEAPLQYCFFDAATRKLSILKLYLALVSVL